MKGLFYILLAYLAGEGISMLTGGFLPGSVLGMVVLFAALKFRAVKAADVERVSTALLSNMLLFFVPVSVGLMVSYEVIGVHLWSIVVTLAVSTVLVVMVVGWLQQKQGRGGRKDVE